MKGLIFAILCLILTSCTPTPKDVIKQDELPPIYPDYCEVTIPENIAPLNFLLRANCEAIEVKAGSLTINARDNEAVFDIDDWKALMEQSAGKEIDVTITALIDGRWIQYKTFHWQVVTDQVDGTTCRYNSDAWRTSRPMHSDITRSWTTDA